MATESSRKIDVENPSLSGICRTLCATSLPARRGGLATLRVPFPVPLAAGALAKQHIIKESRGREAAISFPPTALQEQAPAAVDGNEISIACAMLTP